MRLVFALTLCLALGALAQGAPASASPEKSPEKQRAKERFERGLKLFDAAQGDRALFEAALTEFEAAYELAPAFQVLFNIAVTQKRLGRHGAALTTFERYLREGGERVPQERRLAVDREVKEVRAQVGEVTVEVSGGPAQLWVDGEPMGTTPLMGPLYLTSGNYTFRASRPGHAPDEQQIRVLSGEAMVVKLSPTRTDIGLLRVVTTPPGATLSLDAKEVGPTPWQGEVAAGGHRISATLDGFEPFSLDVVIASGQQREVTGELARTVHWYQRPLVWIGAAVVAGAAATTTWVVTHPPPNESFRL